MAVVNTLTAGIDSSSFTHTNPMVETIQNERQSERKIVYDNNKVSITDEWIGTSEEVKNLLSTNFFKGKGPGDYSWEVDETFVIERYKGDLSKLIHTYSGIHTPETGGENDVDDPIDENLGITPWTIKSETTDIGAVEYYILKNELSKNDADNIKRDRLALWENSPYEKKLEFKYRSQLNGWQTLDRDPKGNVDSEITLTIAKWIVEQQRNQFPLTTARITHEEIVKGPSYKKGKINKTSLKKELAETESNLKFPADEFGKELAEIPDCPYLFDMGYPQKFMLTDWNVTVKDEEGKYLITKEYVSYPEAFPLPLDPTPGN